MSSVFVHESCLNILKSAGADGWTPLLQAAELGDLTLVKELLSQKANIKAKTKVINPMLQKQYCT